MATTRIRDFKKEYRERIEKGKARGLTRTEASGHKERMKGEPIKKPSKQEVARKLVLLSPCMGCECKESPGNCVRLDEWVRKGVA